MNKQKCSRRHKEAAPSSRRGLQGFSLLEALVYCAVLGVVLALASGAFFRVAKASNDLKRNAEDIARALASGERWRADVRAATTVPSWRDSPDGPALYIQQGTNTVAYTFSAGTVWRHTPQAKRVSLRHVKTTTMQPDMRRQVKAWRWEVELDGQPNARVKPVFSFVSVTPVKP